MKRRLHLTYLILLILYLQVACNTIDLYEKSVSIPGHAWGSSFKPSFTFTIRDTTVPYKIFFVLRHTDKYSFNNIYINIITKLPGADTTHTGPLPLELATNEKGWLATGMDDIYEHRIQLSNAGKDFYFRKRGEYTFTVEQIMREDPLKNVLSAGLRIEKKQ
ncbi:MAG: gliding motility lipoprotein GldH [Chitinophagaceae bacterium]|nr:gliding motility lipoprotein GldH [Chitinophagaceae bacterium]MBK8951988.1 gliding motility lipoprotein GldH [Chitinophagaceae bacterium]